MKASSSPSVALDSQDACGCASDLVREIEESPWRFQFRQLVRVLALSARDRGLPLRDSLPASLRFRTPASLAFPSSEVTGSQRQTGEDAELLSLYVSFFGLTGPSGVLPTRYTELLIDRKNNFRDTGLHDFLDIFSHRAIALFYAADQKYRFYRRMELKADEGFSRNLLDIVGVGLQGLRGRLQLTRESGDADRFLMQHAGILSQKPISAKSLEALVRGLLGVDTRFEAFQAAFLELGVEHQSMVGRRNSSLGVDTVVGSRQYDFQTKATLAIGPLNSKAFAELLPGGTAANALRELVYFCVGHALAIDVKLILQRDGIPAPHLSQQATVPKQLGFNTWIRTRPIAEDRSDACYTLQV